jgi:hypothetical protein
MGTPHQRGVPDEGLDCLAGRHGAATSGIGGWLGASPHAPNLVEDGREPAAARGVGKHWHHVVRYLLVLGDSGVHMRAGHAPPRSLNLIDLPRPSENGPAHGLP